jgi:mRNA export factor
MAALSSTLGDLSKDVALSNPPEDSISDIDFSPQSQHLAVASWDKKVRIYEISASGGSEGKAFFDHEGPVLSCHWSKVREVGDITVRTRSRTSSDYDLGWHKGCRWRR